MGKSIFIAEKPSVAREFAKALKLNAKQMDGYLEAQNTIITWCVGHLVTMSYPDAYDERLKRWSLQTVPFIPDKFKYQVIDNVKKQFQIVSGLLNRDDVETIYVCTDSGREGEYIYRLVEQEANVSGKIRKRVWIDSQTEEEILRGIKEAKDLSEYDNLSASAYLRAKEDYLMGINFSRVLTLKYGQNIKDYLQIDKGVVSVGRVMTCVLGMVVNREREIRDFVKTPFYRVLAGLKLNENNFQAEWKAVEGSKYFASPLLYKENGFKERKSAETLITEVGGVCPVNNEEKQNATAQSADAQIEMQKQALAENTGAQNEDVSANNETVNHADSLAMTIESVEKKTEKKNPPLLYNLAEIQNDCSKLFKISPDETLRIIQELYEKKMVTYPRTDARVLSTAVAKEISKNINGLRQYPLVGQAATDIMASGSYKNIAKSRYVNDKQITDHYAIIPTGQGLNNLNSMHPTSAKVYEIIVRRFLSIFLPPAKYQKVSLTASLPNEEKKESFFANFKVLTESGYLDMMQYSFSKKKDDTSKNDSKETTEKDAKQGDEAGESTNGEQEFKCDATFLETLSKLKKGMQIPVGEFVIKEGETSPPKRYTSGSLILAMENAGQLIEDEELRAQIKGQGIGTSATRAEILKKLVANKYLALAEKTQVITPTLLGEVIYEVVDASIKPLLDPKLTASWEKGLSLVADGSITEDEYMQKLSDFVIRRTNYVKQISNQTILRGKFDVISKAYKK